MVVGGDEGRPTNSQKREGQETETGGTVGPKKARGELQVERHGEKCTPKKGYCGIEPRTSGNRGDSKKREGTIASFPNDCLKQPNKPNASDRTQYVAERGLLQGLQCAQQEGGTGRALWPLNEGKVRVGRGSGKKKRVQSGVPT